MPDLSVILVNYNDRKHIADCLSSVCQQLRDISLEILVVDNGSTDGSPELVQHNFPLVRLIQSTENLGYSKANNRGFSESAGAFLLFLNTDTVLPAGALKGILDWMKKHPDVGAAGPLLYRAEDEFQVSFGGKRHFLSEFTGKLFVNVRKRKKISALLEERDASWLSGACLFVRREAFEQSEGFDEAFFLYFEDIDLCYRMEEGGWRIVLVPWLKVFHEGGGSTSSHSLKSRYFYRQSQIYFYDKHNSRLSRILLRAYLSISFGLLWIRGVGNGADDRALRREFFSLLWKKRRKSVGKQRDEEDR